MSEFTAVLRSPDSSLTSVRAFRDRFIDVVDATAVLQADRGIKVIAVKLCNKLLLRYALLFILLISNSYIILGLVHINVENESLRYLIASLYVGDYLSFVNVIEF